MAADILFKLSAAGDATKKFREAKQAAQTLGGAVSDTDKKFKELTDQNLQTTKSLKGMGLASDRLARRNLRDLERAAIQARNEFDSLVKSTSATNEELVRADRAVRKAEREFRAVANAMQFSGQEIKIVRRQTGLLTDEFKNLDSTGDRLKNTFGNIKNEVIRFDYGGTLDGARDLGKAWFTLAGTASLLNKTFPKTAGKILDFGKGLPGVTIALDAVSNAFDRIPPKAKNVVKVGINPLAAGFSALRKSALRFAGPAGIGLTVVGVLSKLVNNARETAKANIELANTYDIASAAAARFRAAQGDAAGGNLLAAYDVKVGITQGNDTTLKALRFLNLEADKLRRADLPTILKEIHQAANDSSRPVFLVDRALKDLGIQAPETFRTAAVESKHWSDNFQKDMAEGVGAINWVKEQWKEIPKFFKDGIDDTGKAIAIGTGRFVRTTKKAFTDTEQAAETTLSRLGIILKGYRDLYDLSPEEQERYARAWFPVDWDFWANRDAEIAKTAIRRNQDDILRQVREGIRRGRELSRQWRDALLPFQPNAAERNLGVWQGEQAVLDAVRTGLGGFRYDPETGTYRSGFGTGTGLEDTGGGGGGSSFDVSGRAFNNLNLRVLTDAFSDGLEAALEDGLQSSELPELAKISRGILDEQLRQASLLETEGERALGFYDANRAHQLRMENLTEQEIAQLKRVEANTAASLQSIADEERRLTAIYQRDVRLESSLAGNRTFDVVDRNQRLQRIRTFNDTLGIGGDSSELRLLERDQVREIVGYTLGVGRLLDRRGFPDNRQQRPFNPVFNIAPGLYSGEELQDLIERVVAEYNRSTGR